jgi:hypothetical protein
VSTKGKALRRHDAFLLPIGDDGPVPMHELVNIIRRLEEIRGEQLVIDWPADLELPQAKRELYATLGVLVRFEPPRTG